MIQFKDSQAQALYQQGKFYQLGQLLRKTAPILFVRPDGNNSVSVFEASKVGPRRVLVSWVSQASSSAPGDGLRDSIDRNFAVQTAPAGGYVFPADAVLAE